MRKFFSDLRWGLAFKRASLLIVIYLVLTYVLGIAFPQTFGVAGEETLFFAINAVFFFFLFAAVYAFSERAKRRRLGKIKEEKSKGPSREKEEGENGHLRGRLNPNTSRRKASRRRRR